MANQIKLARLEAAIQTIVNNALAAEVKNKYARYATVTHVDLSKDAAYAKVYLDCLKRDDMDKVLENVERVAGYLRTRVAHQLNLYQAPALKFVPDDSITYSEHIESLLNQIKDKKE